MSHLEACRHMTRAFPLFRGLRLVPIGAWFLLLPALGPFEPTPALLGASAMAVGTSWWIDRWYRRRFGIVVPDRANLGRSGAILVGWLAASLALAAASAGLLPRPAPLVTVLVLVLFSTVAFFCWPRSFGGESRWVAAGFAAVAIVAGAILVAANQDPSRIGSTGDLFSLSSGAIVCLGGLLEHRSLVRAFSAPRGR